MAVPHYTYLVLKMPGPKGIIAVKGSFEVSDLCDREFHKMAPTMQRRQKTRLQKASSYSKDVLRSPRQRNRE
jgi:hypothetical protein